MSKLINLRKIVISLAIFAIVAFASASIAKADSVTLNLNQGNGSSLPNILYGTVFLNLNASNQIEVTITLLNGASIIATGQDCSICFNSTLNSAITVSNVSTGYALIPPGTPMNLGADGYGDFEYGLDYTGGNGGGCAGNSPPCLSTVTFTVSTLGGFSTVQELIENSINGGLSSPWAVDIICPNCPGQAAGQTGYVGTTEAVPEPASMLLLGSGLLGAAAGVRRHRRSKK